MNPKGPKVSFNTSTERRVVERVVHVLIKGNKTNVRIHEGVKNTYFSIQEIWLFTTKDKSNQ